MIASTLLALLRARHADDVFVDECKSGPTQLTEHERIDAWVMAKSWAHPMVTGYEIKVSRGDFLRDQKWQRYLPMCNALYFVCPAKLIAPNELPDDVGLMWASMTGSRLYTKKRAKPRDVTIPEDVWRYILMSRVRITREQFTSANKREFWEQWLEDQQLDWNFGRQVSSTLAQRIKTEVDAAKAENERLLGLVGQYDEIRALLKSLNLNPDRFSSWRLTETIEEARAVVPRDLLTQLHSVATAAAIARDALEKFQTAPPPSE